MILLQTDLAGADHETAVRQCRVVAQHLLGRNEGDGGIVVGKIVRHLLDLALDPCLVCALSRHNVAFAQMLFAGRQRRHRACAYRVERRRDGYRVLPRIQDAVDAADRVGMALAHAAAPEGVVLALRQHSGRVQAVEGKQTRIPAGGDQRDVVAAFCRRVHRRKVGGDIGVGIERVDHVEVLRQHRRHLRQIGRAAAADNENVDLVFILCHGLRRVNGYARQCLYRRGIAPGKHTDQFGVFVLLHGAFHAASEIAVAAKFL